MVFYIHIHWRLDVCACPLDVQGDFLLTGMVSWLWEYHEVYALAENLKQDFTAPLFRCNHYGTAISTLTLSVL